MIRLASTAILLLLLCRISLYPQHTKTFEGYLSFQWVEQGTYYILKDGLGEGFPAYVDSLLALPGSTLNKQEDRIALQAKLFKDYGMDELPHFTLQVADQLYVVHCDSTQYDKVRGYKREALLKKQQRVKIRLEGQFTTEMIPQLPNIIRSLKIESVKLEKGNTSWKN